MTHPKFVVRLLYRLGYVPSRIKRNLYCAWCGQKFDWEGFTQDDTPNFCSSTHRKKASEARQKRRDGAYTPPKSSVKAPLDLNKVGRCPHPYKVVFRSWEEARAAVQRVDPTMRPYVCECGGLHIGHPSRGKKRKR